MAVASSELHKDEAEEVREVTNIVERHLLKVQPWVGRVT
jgi:hypothetical protein